MGSRVAFSPFLAGGAIHFGGEIGAGSTPDTPAAPVLSASSATKVSGTLSAAISNAVVALLHDYTGRGPTRARTTLGADTIVVTLRDSLTKAERTLAQRGQSTEVLAMRRAFQDTMRDDLVAAIESLTGRTVAAFLSDNLHDPDVAVEIFLMNPHDRDGRRERAMGDGQTLPDG